MFKVKLSLFVEYSRRLQYKIYRKFVAQRNKKRESKKQSPQITQGDEKNEREREREKAVSKLAVETRKKRRPKIVNIQHYSL